MKNWYESLRKWLTTNNKNGSDTLANSLKNEIPIINKLVGRWCSSSYVMKKMKIKAKMGYSSTPIKMAKINENENGGMK